MRPFELADIVRFIDLQRRIVVAFIRKFPAAHNPLLLGLEKKGLLQLESVDWQFRVHGAGVLFSSPEGVMVDVHRELENSELVDAWRLVLYLNSSARGNVIYTDASVTRTLEEFARVGDLLEVSNGSYRLNSSVNG